MSNDKLAQAVRNLIEAQRAPGGATGGFIPKRPSLEHQRGVFLAWQEVHKALAEHEAEKQATLTIEAPNGDKIVAHGSAVDMITLERIIKAKAEKQAGINIAARAKKEQPR